MKNKEWNNAICSNTDGPTNYHKWNIWQRQISENITYMWTLKKWYKWTYLEDREIITDVENKVMVTKGETVRRKDKLGVWD